MELIIETTLICLLGMGRQTTPGIDTSAQEEQGDRDRQMIHLIPTAVTYSKYENLLSIWNQPHLGVKLAELYPWLFVYFFFYCRNFK